MKIDLMGFEVTGASGLNAFFFAAEIKFLYDSMKFLIWDLDE